MKLDCKVTFNSDKVATIEPALATLAGWQGENNAVLVNFIISGLNIAAGIQTKYRVDVVDGAGGIHNGVVMELDNTKAYTSLTVPYHLGREITVAGGRAEIKVVITTFENGLEVNTLMTPPFTAVFGNSRSVGSFGEENNKREINDAVRQAENLLDETKNHAQSVAEEAERLVEAANNSQECLEEAKAAANRAKAYADNIQEASTQALTSATDAERFSIESQNSATEAETSARVSELAKNEAKTHSESSRVSAETAMEMTSVAAASAAEAANSNVAAQNYAADAKESAERITLITKRIYPWEEHDTSEEPKIPGKQARADFSVVKGEKYGARVRLTPQEGYDRVIMQVLSREGDNKTDPVTASAYAVYDPITNWYEAEFEAKRDTKENEILELYVAYPYKVGEDNKVSFDTSCTYGNAEILYLGNFHNLIENQNDKIYTLKNDMSALNDEVIATKGDISNLNGEVIETKGSIEDLNNDLTILGGNVSNLSGEVSTLKNEINDIKQNVVGLNETADDLQSQISQNENRIISELDDYLLLNPTIETDGYRYDYLKSNHYINLGDLSVGTYVAKFQLWQYPEGVLSIYTLDDKDLTYGENFVYLEEHKEIEFTVTENLKSVRLVVHEEITTNYPYAIAKKNVKEDLRRLDSKVDTEIEGVNAKISTVDEKVSTIEESLLIPKVRYMSDSLQLEYVGEEAGMRGYIVANESHSIDVEMNIKAGKPYIVSLVTPQVEDARVGFLTDPTFESEAYYDGDRYSASFIYEKDHDSFRLFGVSLLGGGEVPEEFYTSATLVIEEKELVEIGDIDSALDGIISIQERLIGGDTQ